MSYVIQVEPPPGVDPRAIWSANLAQPRMYETVSHHTYSHPFLSITISLSEMSVHVCHTKKRTSEKEGKECEIIIRK